MTPEQRTANPTPSVSPGTEDTKTIAANAQGTLVGLRVGVLSVSVGEASLSASPAGAGSSAGRDKESGATEPESIAGGPGDAFALAAGHRLTIDAIDYDPDHGDGGTSTATITVRAPR
ncbi:hypothetical protein [Nocardiopsis coralliicola]